MATKQLFKMECRPKDQTYGAYKATATAKGMDSVDEQTWKALPVEGGDEEPEKDEEEEPEATEPEEKEPADDKSEIGKSLAAFDAVTAASAPSGGNRETYLKARLNAGTISKSEQSELGRLWAGTEISKAVRDNGQPLRKALSEYLADGDADLVDAQPILKALMDGVNDRLGEIGEQVAGDGKATRELLKAQGGLVRVLAVELDRMSKINKALEQRLNIVERSPAPRRAVTTPAPTQTRQLAKSAVQGAEPSRLSKGQVLTGLNALVKAAHDNGDRATMTWLTTETARFEGGGELSAPALRSVTDLYR